VGRATLRGPTGPRPGHRLEAGAAPQAVVPAKRPPPDQSSGVGRRRGTYEPGAVKSSAPTRAAPQKMKAGDASITGLPFEYRRASRFYSAAFTSVIAGVACSR